MNDWVGPLIALLLLALPATTCGVLVARGPHGPAVADAQRAILDGLRSGEDVAAVVSRAVVLEHHVRRKMGTGMWLAVERTLDLQLPGGYAIHAHTEAWQDGEPLPGKPERRHACPDAGSGRIVPSFQSELAINRRHEIPAGTKTTIRVRTRLRLTAPGGGEMWSGSHATEHPVEVFIGLPFEQIELVTDPSLAPELRVEAQPPGARLQNDPRLFPRLLLGCKRPPVTVSGRLEIADAKGNLLKKTELFFADRDDGTTILPLTFPELLPGQHELTVRVTPDPRPTLRLSPRVQRIWGLVIEKRVSVEVR